MQDSTTDHTGEQARPLLVALTGGVASGKTSVSDRLSEKGVPVVDTDLLAREAVAPGSPGLSAVVDAFGPEILDEAGSLDRRALRERIFAHPEQRETLEAILHPLIEREARRQIERHEDADYVVLVVPLLIESGLFKDADRIVVVDVPESVQIERLLERDGVEPEQAEAMLSAQASRSERLAVATDVIDNSGSFDELVQATDELHERLGALSRRRSRSPRRP
ncbi:MULTISPECIES: dephospho-CoA kinase [unclassified Wenzhouxiangella]|uniref:dephospho-CoA kinase n=1 Tax=unclassified Wenzhouxiangella TaxID=2613841 RepID=UPI000E32D325|nr:MULTISPECIES: dephospho-CoA kinase [unclassified Wenzhouxiangella]RFF28244.1 dephospho-CoA kinase [Wenzhouxiangella sp. 15181]RFP67919.1 dephospho-CoA kinase [Wenzhouxiangella sp. 15190]